jgi:sugar lactone lactonase YvrE
VDAVKKHIDLIDAAGKKRMVYDGHGMTAPAALALFPDQGMLLVADSQSRFNWSFQIAPDGSLINGEPLYRVDLAEASTRGSAGATVDSIGQAYFATALGIQLCEQNGRCGAILGKPEHGEFSAITYGGPELGWLYAVEGNKLFRRQVKTRGVDISTRVKPPKPPL